MPDDVAALTWDAMRLVQTAIEGAGQLTGNLEKDRKAVRDALASASVPNKDEWLDEVAGLHKRFYELRVLFDRLLGVYNAKHI